MAENPYEARDVIAMGLMGVLTLVLELVEGETLKGPLPISKALDYARQIAESLEAAHAKGVVHRS